jgi:hypothetical protein
VVQVLLFQIKMARSPSSQQIFALFYLEHVSAQSGYSQAIGKYDSSIQGCWGFGHLPSYDNLKHKTIQCFGNCISSVLA